MKQTIKRGAEFHVPSKIRIQMEINHFLNKHVVQKKNVNTLNNSEYYIELSLHLKT